MSRESSIDPVSMLRPRRKIQGISAILLPFAEPGKIAWGEFETHLGRTLTAGLTPAVNMDTGYGHLLPDENHFCQYLIFVKKVSSSRYGQGVHQLQCIS